eukprot:scaffold64428_cov21-Tisochrysis_lutea.AAC.1
MYLTWIVLDAALQGAWHGAWHVQQIQLTFLFHVHSKERIQYFHFPCCCHAGRMAHSNASSRYLQSSASSKCVACPGAD